MTPLDVEKETVVLSLIMTLKGATIQIASEKKRVAISSGANARGGIVHSVIKFHKKSKWHWEKCIVCPIKKCCNWCWKWTRIVGVHCVINCFVGSVTERNIPDGNWKDSHNRKMTLTSRMWAGVWTMWNADSEAQARKNGRPVWRLAVSETWWAGFAKWQKKCANDAGWMIDMPKMEVRKFTDWYGLFSQIQTGLVILWRVIIRS